MPSNLNLNMSDYQKIIFANNINENTLQNNFSDIHNMKELSEKYPFVVFFTNYRDNDETNGETIHNIWENGFRLTRFVGIDPNANKIQLGDHTVKLHFDYTSGLLSVVDCNQLEKIELYKVIYTARNNASRELDGVSLQNMLIDAKDNKFTLVFKFTLDGNSDNDINQITKNLNVSSNNFNNFTIGNIYQYTTGVSSTSKVGYYAFDCTIKYDTELASNNSYTLTSVYDSTVSTQINDLRLRLNPTDYDIILSSNGQKIKDTHRISLSANTPHQFEVLVYPNGYASNSYPTEKTGQTLVLNVDAPNCGVTNPSQHINNGSLYFTITTPNLSGNSNNIFNVNLSLVNDANNIRSYINKNFQISLTGGIVYFYCGYENPLTFTSTNQMQNISGYINNKGYILYDWNDTDISDDRGQYFYIAFTEGYENQIITCWDAYTKNNGTNMYLKIEDNTRFIRQTASTGTGLTVYKSSVPGKFFGKIQIQ